MNETENDYVICAIIQKSIKSRIYLAQLLDFNFLTSKAKTFIISPCESSGRQLI